MSARKLLAGAPIAAALAGAGIAASGTASAFPGCCPGGGAGFGAFGLLRRSERYPDGSYDHTVMIFGGWQASRVCPPDPANPAIPLAWVPGQLRVPQMKRALAGLMGAAAIAAAVPLAAPAQAAPGAWITSIVYWTGPDCIPVRYSKGFYIDTDMICGRYSERHYFALPGQYVGADPMPFDTTTTLGCSLLINGVPDNTDYAPAGDRHNVNCLRVFVPAYGYYRGVG